MGDTHLMGGAAAWLAGCAATHPAPLVTTLGLGLALAGSLAVDIDHERADAAQFARLGGTAGVAAAAVLAVTSPHSRTWLMLGGAGLVVAMVPWLVRPHGGGFRGVIHSQFGLGFAVAASFLPCFWGWPAWAGAAIMTGWVSHLVLDGLTKEGLPLRWVPGEPRYAQERYGWLPRSQSMTTGGPRPGRRKGRKRRRKAGLEYKLVQPALAVFIAAAGALILTGGHL
jgi:hypothetical protein